MKKKNGFRLLSAAVMGLGLVTFSNLSYASNDNVGFSFALKPNYGNSYTESRYRQTTDTSNKWKVNLTYSAEGKGSIATFWLDKNGTLASNTYNVAQGSDAHYYNAYQTANQSNVRLGAENNNYTANSYTVSGYWDEEIN